MGVIFGILIAVILGAMIFAWVVVTPGSESDSEGWAAASPVVIQIAPPPAHPAPFATPTP